MDSFELKPEPKKLKPKLMIFNLLTVLVLISVVCLVIYFVTLFLNPYSVLNPFPPQALPTLYKSPTPTYTPLPQPSTWTPSPTLAPSPTRTKAPTWTLIPEMVTPSDIPASIEPTITMTAMPAAAEVTYAASTTTHPDLACNWMGVGGRVLSTNGDPLQFQTIQLGGSLGGQPISRSTLSGTATTYGPSGFEFVLSDHPIASEQNLWILLFDNTGVPLMEKMYFDTFANCAQNLVMIVFTISR